MSDVKEKVKRLWEDLKKSKHAIALTGAGISAESGIPTFRGSQGLWEKYDPDEYAHISSFLRNPEKVWEMLRELIKILKEAKPNPAHVALAELEKRGILKSIITQNVDSLHQKAGSKNVIEFHGTNERLVCIYCKDVSVDAYSLDYSELPRCPNCGRLLKPDVVFFGEPIPPKALEEAFKEARRCDLCLVIGTSAVVYPAADIPYTAKEHGALVIEINPTPTPLTGVVADYSIKGKAGEVFSELLKLMREEKLG